MDFFKLCKLVGDQLPDKKNLDVSIRAHRDDKGQWSVKFVVGSIYDADQQATSPEALLMKVRADKIPPVLIEDVGLISKSSEA